MSHAFVERLIGTIRREYLDVAFFWNAIDLYRKLEDFRIYYNGYRVHRSLNGTTPASRAADPMETTLSWPIRDTRHRLISNSTPQDFHCTLSQEPPARIHHLCSSQRNYPLASYGRS